MDKVVWRQVEAEKTTLASWLTLHNFQPGKFVVLEHPFNKDSAIVAFVDLDTPKLKRFGRQNTKKHSKLST